MRWSIVLATALAALVTVTTVVWMEVRQEREFRRLVAEGDAALAADRTSEAIEAFSGALAFKPDSMLAHLQRAETYRRRGDSDLPAALRCHVNRDATGRAHQKKAPSGEGAIRGRPVARARVLVLRAVRARLSSWIRRPCGRA